MQNKERIFLPVTSTAKPGHQSRINNSQAQKSQPIHKKGLDDLKSNKIIHVRLRSSKRVTPGIIKDSLSLPPFIANNRRHVSEQNLSTLPHSRKFAEDMHKTLPENTLDEDLASNCDESLPSTIHTNDTPENWITSRPQIYHAPPVYENDWDIGNQDSSVRSSSAPSSGGYYMKTNRNRHVKEYHWPSNEPETKSRKNISLFRASSPLCLLLCFILALLLLGVITGVTTVVFLARSATTTLKTDTNSLSSTISAVRTTTTTPTTVTTETTSTTTTTTTTTATSTSSSSTTSTTTTTTTSATIITATTTTSTTSTSTTTTTTTTTIATTTTATIATLSTISTTAVTTINGNGTGGSTCVSQCLNATVSNASRIAFYSFDSNTFDVTGSHPMSGISSPTYVRGWVGPAINFNNSNNERLYTDHIALNSRTFTIDFWFRAVEINSTKDYSFMGEYMINESNSALFLNIHNSAILFGFYGDDTISNATIKNKKWYHVAFVYENTTRQRSIFLNGVLDSQSIANNPFLATSGNFSIGGAHLNPGVDGYFAGFIDHVTISSRAKSACEICLDANLACYFQFNSTDPLLDSGPNFLVANNTGASFTTGKIGDGLQFSNSLSYFTINNISALESENSMFTISMWVNPLNNTSGTLIHASTQSDGQGSCFAMWGFASNGVISVNIFNVTNSTVSSSTSFPLPINAWTHVAQTFSSTTGNQLYVNGSLVAYSAVTNGYSIGPYVTIGASPSGTNNCSAGAITMGQFYGIVDEFRVFGQELSSTDIYYIANS